jgi:hypothetical protein
MVPSCPCIRRYFDPAPQVSNCPKGVTRAEEFWLAITDLAANCLPREVGLYNWFRFPVPSCPCLFSPHTYTSPDSERARECAKPHETSATGTSAPEESWNENGEGTCFVLQRPEPSCPHSPAPHDQSCLLCPIILIKLRPALVEKHIHNNAPYLCDSKCKICSTSHLNN